MILRENFLDKLRVLATCAVVLLHTVTGVMDHTDMSLYPLENKVFLVTLDLVCWCVPIFLLISGYLFLNPDREITFRKMLTRYCRRIVLALFVFGVPYACLEQIAVERCFRAGMAGRSFLMVIRGESWSHLWYLYLILALYLLTPAIRKLLEVLPRPALYGLLAVLFTGSSVLPYLAKLTGVETLPALPDLGIYFFYYISGSLFRGKKQNDLSQGDENAAGVRSDMHSAEKRGKLMFGLAALLAVAMACSRLPGNYTVQMAYNYPFTVMLSLLLFAWGNTADAAFFQKSREHTYFWKRAAELSFTVYLVHPVFLNIAYKFIDVTPLSFFIGISLTVFFLTTLLLAAALAWILYQIPLLRKYVL